MHHYASMCNPYSRYQKAEGSGESPTFFFFWPWKGRQGSCISYPLGKQMMISWFFSRQQRALSVTAEQHILEMVRSCAGVGP
ncbi:hypothetical protein TESG_02246 [Trichophyton tonsurans CBS 112818]|uniref:Uncharacterized protein n=1 Tax=Trichophyton tonsurans (strain CBS 112818) TaxID=647933 RepID=F2RTU2_TRIT1|nr:hypothetical protein TESG_02246 [Trichophyton tonsurans CBS 112818]